MRRAVAVLAFIVSAVALVAVVTAASVALTTPDALGDPCARPQLVVAQECAPAT